jgi:hypothetical protein
VGSYWRPIGDLGLAEVRELRVLLHALVDDLVKEVPFAEPYGLRSAGMASPDV